MKKFHFVYNFLALVRIQMVCALKLGDLKWKEKILQFTTIIKKVLCGVFTQQILKEGYSAVFTQQILKEGYSAECILCLG